MYQATKFVEFCHRTGVGIKVSGGETGFASSLIDPAEAGAAELLPAPAPGQAVRALSNSQSLGVGNLAGLRKRVAVGWRDDSHSLGARMASKRVRMRIMSPGTQPASLASANSF